MSDENRTVRVDVATVSASPKLTGEYVEAEVLNWDAWQAGKEDCWIRIGGRVFSPLCVDEMEIHPEDRRAACSP